MLSFRISISPASRLEKFSWVAGGLCEVPLCPTCLNPELRSGDWTGIIGRKEGPHLWGVQCKELTKSHNAYYLADRVCCLVV